MATHWKDLKSIISSNELKNDLFLTLINEEGTILCANANMQRTLHLKNPREVQTNFFELLHPEHIHTFREAIADSKGGSTPSSAELYLKNGYYHPMRWQVNFLDNEEGDTSTTANYLCVGYKLVDDERLKQYNQLGEQNYQLIVEGVNAGVLFQDKDGELIAANKKAAAILGTTLERLYQLRDIRSLWDKVWSVTNEEGAHVSFYDTPYMKALQTNTIQSQVLLIKLQSGEVRHIQYHCQPLVNPGAATPFSVVTTIVDITVEKELSRTVAEREELFHAFMDKTPNLAWVVSRDSNLLFANDAFLNYFNLDHAKAINQPIFELVPEIVAEALYTKHKEVGETGKPIEIVEKVKWADGSNFVFHINLFPIKTGSGKRLVGGHAVNLADKYAVEKKLRDANDRLLLISRATTDAIWEWDMQTGHIFRNDALMDLIGYQGDDSKGLSWWLRRIHPEDRNRVTDTIKDATDKGQHSWEDEYRFKCSDGTYKHIQDRGYVVYENGLPVKMIGSLQDVTEVKDLEDQLMQEKLHRQKEISEMVIRVQEKERTRIGHELHDNVNQILSTTRMFVDMLKPSSLEEKKIKAKCIEYLMTSIEEIRKLSKELVVPQLKDRSLVESINTLLEDIELSAPIRVTFVHDLENELLSAGKKVTIFRIVQEQFKNILKYSHADQVDIYFHCRDEQAQLIIKDNGVGFDPKQVHRGIGLSNIHDRTQFYNGHVDIQSSPGQGCILTVTIPVI